jgi:hypothetical protein
MPVGPMYVGGAVIQQHNYLNHHVRVTCVLARCYVPTWALPYNSLSFCWCRPVLLLFSIGCCFLTAVFELIAICCRDWRFGVGPDGWAVTENPFSQIHLYRYEKYKCDIAHMECTYIIWNRVDIRSKWDYRIILTESWNLQTWRIKYIRGHHKIWNRQ